MKVLVTIDTEEAWDWSGSYPIQDFSVEHISRLGEFQSICDQYGFRPTYFTNHAVMNNPKSSRIMTDLSRHKGVEVGMHIHPWTTPPYRIGHTVTSRDTYLHNAREDEIRLRLAAVYNALEAAGIRPTSFRGGRYSTGSEIHRFLHEKGFIAECSVVPYTTWSEDGSPDFRHRDVYPVRLAPERPNGSPLWEIPLSMGFTRRPFGVWAAAFRLIEGTPLKHLRLIGIAERLGILRRVWLNFEVNDPYDWMPFLLLLQRMNVPCVTLTVHSSSLFSGPGPYTRTAEDEKRIFEKITCVFQQLNELNWLEPATASEAALFLEDRYARTGH
jgi:hypothetical protein